MFGSAVKVGGKANAKLFNDDSTVNPNADLSKSVLSVPRENFGIQQNVPLHTDLHIKAVTQAYKNLFVNILDVDNFSYHGKTYNGKELRDELFDNFKLVYDQQWKKFADEIGFDGNLVNVSKLRRVLLSEAISQGYDTKELEILMNNDATGFIPFDRLVARHEAFLNSIVSHRVASVAMPGIPYVLGSSVGYKPVENIEKLKGSIVYTTAFDKELKYGTKGKPTQVIIPWNFRDADGKLFDIKQYIKDGKIDFAMLPEEMLEAFGMRIPNQGHNLQSYLQIAGFFPTYSGNLMVTANDLAVQMGFDFDVDKLYTYMPQYDVAADGKIVKKETPKNNIIDICIAVHNNPNDIVQDQIHKPLEPTVYKNTADEIWSAQGEKYRTLLSDDYQTYKYLNGKDAKGLIAIYASLSSLNGVAQGLGLQYHFNLGDGAVKQVELFKDKIKSFSSGFS